MSDGSWPVQLAAGLAAADPGHFWLWTLAALALALGAFVYAFHALHRARLIENTPTSRIRSAAQGYVELEGVAQLLPGPVIISPLSAAHCCWWKYRIQKRERSGNKERWRTIDSATSEELFLLDDGSGDCIVDPAGAKVYPSLRRQWRGNSRRPQRIPDKTSWLQFGDFRYEEELIQIGMPLHALGWFRTQSGAHAFDERADVTELLREWKADQAELLARYDADGDGRIDEQEWEAARSAALEQVRRQHLARSVDPDVHVLSRPRDRRPFVLSTLPQAKLAGRYRGKAVIGLSLFLISGICGVFALLSRGLL
jgi:hypothetical protein